MPPEIIKPGGQAAQEPSATPPPTPPPQPADPSPAELDTPPAPQPTNPKPAQPLFAPDQPFAKPPKKRLRLPGRPGWLTKKVAVIASLALVLILAGSGLAYVKMMNNKPEKVLADALSNSVSDYLDRKPLNTLGKLTVESKDQTDNYKFTVDFGVKRSGETVESTASLRIEVKKIDVTVKGTWASFGENETFVKFDDLAKTFKDVKTSFPEYTTDYASIMPALEQFFNKIDGRWIKVDGESLLTQFGYIEPSGDKACSKAFKELRVSKDDRKKIKSIFKQHQFAIATEKLPKQGIDGENSYHYKMDFNEQKASDFQKALIELPSFTNFKNACNINSERFETAGSSEASDTKPVIELWVGTKTRRPTKLKIALDDKEMVLEFNTTIKFNAPDINIEKPTEYLSPEELQKELDAIYGGTTTDPDAGGDDGLGARDTERQTDIKALHGQIEAYYAQEGFYPSLSNLNDKAWRAANMKGLDDEALKDPKGSAYVLVSAPTSNAYSYAATDSDGSSCDNVDKECQEYTLTATYEAGGTYTKSSLN